jgi:hypothetical protein
MRSFPLDGAICAEDNPYVFHPLTYWAIAIFCLVAPFLFSDRWWIQSALATIPVFWLIALMAFTSGLGSRRWRRVRRQGSALRKDRTDTIAGERTTLGRVRASGIASK